MRVGNLCDRVKDACVSLERKHDFLVDCTFTAWYARVITTAIQFGSPDDAHTIITSAAFASVLRFAQAKVAFKDQLGGAKLRLHVRALLETTLRTSPQSLRLCLTTDDLTNLIVSFAFRDLDLELYVDELQGSEVTEHRRAPTWRARIEAVALETGLSACFV